MTEASANSMRKVHQFVDPDLHRAHHTWADLAVPPRLQEIAEESWQALSGLADEGGDTADRHATLDQLREAYVALYDEAEGIAASSADAARREGVAASRRRPSPRGSSGSWADDRVDACATARATRRTTSPGRGPTVR